MPRGRPPISFEIGVAIIRLTLAGESANKIHATLNVHRSTIARFYEAVGGRSVIGEMGKTMSAEQIAAHRYIDATAPRRHIDIECVECGGTGRIRKDVTWIPTKA